MKTKLISYDANGNILLDVDGTVWTVRSDDTDSHYGKIVKGLIDKGNTIPPYEEPPKPEPKPVRVVTMRQAKIQLSRAGLFSAVEDAINNMEGQQGEEARIEWMTATEFDRDNPLVTMIAASMGLDEPTIDKLFEKASKIK